MKVSIIHARKHKETGKSKDGNEICLEAISDVTFSLSKFLVSRRIKV